MLNKSTLPKESVVLFKLSYFNLLVKPVLKTLERAIRVNGPSSEIVDFYRRASTKIFRFWLKKEPKHEEQLKEQIVALSNGDASKWMKVEYLEKLVFKESLARLCRETDSRQFDGSINHVNEPNIILTFSNGRSTRLNKCL